METEEDVELAERASSPAPQSPAPTQSPQLQEASPGGAALAESRNGSLELGRRLLAAARDGDCEAVLDLMSRGAPFTTDWLGTSALHLAAGSGHADAAALLLRAGALRDARSKTERTPLHVAAHGAHEDVVALLLAHGAQVDVQDMLGMTPLAWAVERGALAAARLLLARGADPARRSKFRTAPRDLARRPGRTKMLELIEKTIKERAEMLTSAADDDTAEKDEKKEYIIISDRKVMSKSSEHQNKTNQDPATTRVSSSPKKPATDKESTEVGGESAESNAGGGGAGGGEEGAAARLLRSHGITLLPPEPGAGTVLAALQAGRTLLLSDAGKLMLKESSQVSVAPTAVPAAGAAPAVTGGGATPARRVVPRLTTANITLKKIVNPNNKQVKYVALPNLPARLVQPAPAPTNNPNPPPPPPPTTPTAPTFRVLRPLLRPAGPGKQFKLADTTISSAGASAINSSKAGGAAAAAAGVVRVPAEFLTSSSTEYLRAQLLAAHAELATARAALRALRARVRED